MPASDPEPAEPHRRGKISSVSTGLPEGLQVGERGQRAGGRLVPAGAPLVQRGDPVGARRQPGGQRGHAGESVVRLRRLDTGKARWRSFVRDKVLKPRKKPLSLLDHFVKVSMPVRSGQTSLLMNLEEFSQRLQHFRDVFKWRSDGHALEDLRPAERDCWDYTPPWIHREMEQEQLERGTPAQSAQGSRELMLEEELASLRRLLEAKDNRIEALELAMAKDKAGQRERRPSTSLGREAPGVRKDAHGQVMSRVRELIDSGRQRQAAEQQLLERHLQDLATGSSSSLEKLRALRSEVRSEVHFKNTATDEAERLAAQLQSCEEKLEEKLRHGSCSGEYDVEQHLLDSEADAATQLMLAAAQLSGKSKERWELPRRACRGDWGCCQGLGGR
ncbi:unnamed protein product [Effrenium voratum]|nr:unnamed protein product [Effrenium voratum]